MSKVAAGTVRRIAAVQQHQDKVPCRLHRSTFQRRRNKQATAREVASTMTERVVSTQITDEERSMETVLRPQTLKEYVGQERMKESLRICIEAAKQRNEALDHTIFYGPPGLGKTTIAHIIAREMGASLRSTSGLVLAHAGDLAAILTNLQEHDVLFIDEIHRLPAPVEEALYPAMEDYQLDLVIGQGPAARTVKLDLPRFTLVGATTRAGALTSPLRDRFGLVHRLEFYSPV